MTHTYAPRVSLSGLIVSCVVLAGLTGCGGGGGAPATATVPPAAMTPTPTPTPTPAPTPTPSSAPKPILKGLVTQGAASQSAANPPANSFAELNAHPGVYTAAVVDLFWSQLEPSQGVFDDSALTSALAKLAAYNTQYPTTPVTAKLRIFAGVGTPAWVIAATGGVTITDSQGHSGTGGKFWTTAYQGFWRGLQAHLAAAYDASAMVSEVAISSCSTITAEPFILPHDAATIVALMQAGYTDAQGRACLTNAPGDYAAWTRTPLDYTFNTFTTIDGGTPGTDTAFTIQVMDAFRAALGTRGVVANHGLQSPLGPGATSIYGEFANLYTQAQAATPPTVSPLEFQTISPTVDWPSAITLALTYHPTEIEVWDTVAAGGQAPLSLAQLQQWAAALK